MTAPPGWYPDPGGAPDLYRFYDGAAWSETTSPNPASPPPGQAPATPALVGPYAPGPRRSTAGWIIAAGALLLVVIVVVVVAVRSLGGDKPVTPPTPGPAPSSTTCPDAARPSAAPAGQTGARVSSGRLSYPRLGAPFRAPKYDSRVPFGRDVQNQDATVEVSTDGKVTWVAAVLIARLLAGDGFFGPEQGAKVVADCVVGRFYGDSAVQRDDRRNAGLTVDGHQAWTIESHLSFEIPNIKTTGETMIIVVVDTGESEAGLFYASIPDTSPELLKPARAALADLQVG